MILFQWRSLAAKILGFEKINEVHKLCGLLHRHGDYGKVGIAQDGKFFCLRICVSVTVKTVLTVSPLNFEKHGNGQEKVCRPSCACVFSLFSPLIGGGTTKC